MLKRLPLSFVNRERDKQDVRERRGSRKRDSDLSLFSRKSSESLTNNEI